MDALEYLTSVGGVARVGLLRANGYAPSAIRKLASAGGHQPRKGVWAIPSADPEYLTAILNNGHLTCGSAATRYGLWIKDKPGRVHLATRHCRGRGFVRHGGLRLPLENSVPVASVEDTVIHALTCLPEVDAISIAQSAMQQFGVPLAMLESEIPANYYGNARRLLAKADFLSESVPEISARLLFESEGLTFRRQVKIRGVGRVDFLIGRRLIVEVNGYAFHSSREAWRKDMARLNAAQLRGFVLLSFAPETIWNNPEHVMEEIRAVLARDDQPR
ncbi:endonuclease domain-containing protein [Arthrobacter sp. NA-172]|uniref:endonuclease domain-containing protein n=1 Tax=Arthrobacter sp. NA-172 TaxID=3367524 RepID=UPI003754F755